MTVFCRLAIETKTHKTVNESLILVQKKTESKLIYIILLFILYLMSEPKLTYTKVNLKPRAINRPIKSTKIGAEFHALLAAMRNESDGRMMTMQRINELAIKDWAVRYYPQCLPVLTGGEIDDSKRPAPFENRTQGNELDK